MRRPYVPSPVLAFAAAASMFGLLACAGAAAHDDRIVGDGYISTRSATTLFELASIELDCPKPDLRLQRLQAHGEQVLARGCGRRGIYVYTDVGWVLRSVSTSDGSFRVD